MILFQLIARVLWAWLLFSSFSLASPINSTAPLISNATISEIEAARQIVKDAIAQATKLNKARLANPARNHYELKPGTIIGGSASTKRSSRRDQDSTPPPPLLNITAEIAAAAALVAEANAVGTTNSTLNKRSSFWMEGISRKGTSPWNSDSSYKIYRNVKTDYGAAGDGKTDDTAAINRAITDGKRCGAGCNGSSNKNAIVYLPAGTYLVSSSLVILYGTQFIGDATNPPLIKAASSFVGLGVLSTDVYVGDGAGTDGLDNEWYVNTASFYRQIRNLKIDITATDPNAQVCAIHYQIAQATSLQNVELIAKTGTTQQGMFSENGSGGVMADVTFTGGKFGFYGGNQQFTVQRVTFNGCDTAVDIIWDWGWVWKSVTITNANVGFRLVNDDGSGNVGSAVFIDSQFSNVKQAIVIKPPSSNPGTGTTNVVLDNVAFNSVTQAIADTNGKSILSGVTNVQSWVMGPIYNDTLRTWSTGTTSMEQLRELTLLGELNGLPNVPYFERAKPQYTSNVVSDFVHLKDLGAKGDGSTDDTAAVQSALNNNVGKIIFADAGVYLLTDTVTIPPGTKIVGETWTQFAATGTKFSDPKNPVPMLKVGNAGDKGSVEMQDLLFTTKGPTPGAILVEWNILADAKGSAGLWDCHARLGGATGTALTPTECPALTTGVVNSNCQTAALVMHVTNGASGYFENMWLWTADHMIDDPDLTDDKNPMTMISVYTARGFLIESQTATWLYGTASEHAVYYQYNFNGARNVFAGLVQTETPYYQPSPKAPNPFSADLNPDFGDPDYTCPGTDFDGCDSSWGVIIQDSQDIYVASAGIYSWFDTYTQTCIDVHTCQHALVLLKDNYHRVRVQQLITIGAKYSITDGTNGTLATDNLAISAHPAWSQISLYDAPSLGDAPVPLPIPDFPSLPDCPSLSSYPSVDAVINDTSIPEYCINTYLIQGMANTLTDSINTYNDLMANDYDTLYNYYVKAIKASAPAQFDKFYHSDDLDKYFTCYYLVPQGSDSYKNQSGPGCPPNNEPDFASGRAYNIYFVANNMTDWLDFMENTYGIDRSWIVPYSYRDIGCINGQPCDDFGNVYWYQVPDNIDIPDPAEFITANLANYTGIAEWLSEIAVEASAEFYPGSDSDVVDGAAMTVYSVAGAVAAMKTVEDIGKKEEDTEALQIILFFVSAILMLLPGVGEELSAIADSAIFARLGALLSDAGNLALTVYDIVKDPSSAPMAIGGFLVGGLASRDSSAFTKAASKKRDLPNSVIEDLGTDISTGMEKVSGKYKLCDI